jgi:Domain of unknown function DUF29
MNRQREVNGAAANVREPAVVRLEDDFYGWLRYQASMLRAHSQSGLDWENLAEELEGMSRGEEAALESQLIRLLKHLLKFRYQANRITGSWEASIDDAREQIDRIIRRSPSLKSKIGDSFAAAYPRARRAAGAEMRLRKRDWERLIPSSCEWPLATALNANFWPSAASVEP